MKGLGILALSLFYLLYIPGCGGVKVGGYVMRANDLADQALLLEDTIATATASVPEEYRPQVEQSVSSLKLLVSEARRFESIDDVTKLDLRKMYLVYLRAKEDVRYIKWAIYDAGDGAAWKSLPVSDQLRLQFLFSDLQDISSDIDSFVESDTTSERLVTAAKITAYATVLVRLVAKAVPMIDDFGGAL